MRDAVDILNERISELEAENESLKAQFENLAKQIKAYEVYLANQAIQITAMQPDVGYYKQTVKQQNKAIRRKNKLIKRLRD